MREKRSSDAGNVSGDLFCENYFVFDTFRQRFFCKSDMYINKKRKITYAEGTIYLSKNSLAYVVIRLKKKQKKGIRMNNEKKNEKIYCSTPCISPNVYGLCIRICCGNKYGTK